MKNTAVGTPAVDVMPMKTTSHEMILDPSIFEMTDHKQNLMNCKMHQNYMSM